MTPFDKDAVPAWHAIDIQHAFSLLEGRRDGLTHTEAEHRLARDGFNEIEKSRGVSPLRLFLAQFRSVLILILLAGIGFSIYAGHTVESVVIGAVVLLAVLLGFVQEYRAERAMEALRKLAAPTATVLRNGEWAEVPAHLLVVGDVVRLQTGNRVPADLRLLETVNLSLNEASLTGESVPLGKAAEARVAANAPLGDRCNLAYAGTVVTCGRGLGLVVATGMRTEFGRIVKLLQTATQQNTPLQRSLNRVGNILALVALAIVAVIVVLGLARGEPLHEMLLFGIALAVAVVPEALPAVVTISLAIGARRMVARNALIRRLPAVETLGCTSIICSDKTGTLTRDEMTVRRLWSAGECLAMTGAGYEPVGKLLRDGAEIPVPAPVTELLRAGTLVNDAELLRMEDGRWEIRGDPTEGALLVAAAKAGLWKTELEKQWPRMAEIPFSSEAKCMTTFHRPPREVGDNGQIAFAKGALEVLLGRCSHWLTAAGERVLDTETREWVRTEAETMAGQALRVLAVARKREAAAGPAIDDFCLLGLIGMIDPPRAESRDAIAVCKRAGIRVVMITGDHPLTAHAVARELGILEQGRVLTGAELETLTPEELERAVDSVEVFARVAPEHKLRVVLALQKRGAVVAMTGDGVNDAPALRQADIGIAMGVTGTDVSREASDMMLTDDNFASIVAAVEEGRGIFSNIRKYLMYLLSSNIGEIGLMTGASLLGLPLPLSAVQILYVNLATDGLPALALAVDPLDTALMRQGPRDPRRGLFTPPVVFLMLVGGAWSTAVNLGLFIWLLDHGRSVTEAMTVILGTLVLIEFFKAYAFRSDHRSMFRRPFANRWLNLAVAWELALLLAVTQIPLLQTVFETTAPTLEDWLLSAGLAATIIPVLELAKLVVRWLGGKTRHPA